MNDDRQPTISKTYAGDTAIHYQALSELGLAPAVVTITDNEIVTVEHQPLRSWLDENPSDDARAGMARKIVGLLENVHQQAGICHRDVHIDNIVIAGDDRPLLIDPAYATATVNDRCYDLEGPGPSRVAVPADHIAQGHDGVWWGSSQKHRSLKATFGPPPQ